MSIRNLEYLFRPRSVAVIGASLRPRRVGSTVLANLHDGGFEGPIFAVNPKYHTLLGEPCHASLRNLPEPPDLAVICTPAHTVAGVVAELAGLGTRAAIVLTAGLGKAEGSACRRVLEAARPVLMRLLGPNCIGLISPVIGLNASFAPASASAGSLAFVSQSGALATAMLDWARARHIGFSHFVSLGDSLDVDVADVLDYLATDTETHAILLYVEAVRDGRKFMSAARAAARSKPVLIVKAGRTPEAAQAATTHTGALAGSDDVYDAAIRRAGMLRVASTDALFDAVETLARARPVNGNRLAILTNGGGAGVMATDALIAGGGTLAALSTATLSALDRVLPPSWSHANPVDMRGDAPITSYADSARILANVPEADAVLILHAPTAIVPNGDIATVIVASRQPRDLPLFTAWLGGDAVANDREICRAAGVPTYETPEQAVRGFLQAAEYRRNLDLLGQTPPALANDLLLHRDSARAVVATVRSGGRDMLSEQESKQVLAAYGIPVVQTLHADDAASAATLAASIGFPVALKIVSPDITHKSTVGGVALDLYTSEAVLAAANAMSDRIASLRPETRLQGFTIQRMMRPQGAVEVILGVVTDPVFGPAILFGHGGTAVEQVGDHAIALPPLNRLLAADLVQRTRVARVLERCGAAAMEELTRVLMRLSGLVCDMEDVAALDINPLLVSTEGVLALDARIALTGGRDALRTPLAIVPYPRELESHLRWRDRPLLVRPIRPEDEEAMRAFFGHMTAADIHTRYFCTFNSPGHEQLSRLTQIDYAREMAFVAILDDPASGPCIVGEARAVADPDNITAEFGLVVRSDCKRQGIGTMLLDKLVAYCRAKGTHRLAGSVLAGNLPMLTLARHVGFSIDVASDGDVIPVHLELADMPPESGCQQVSHVG